ncbi:hypothetical protein FUAX_43040 (plasmid) [Fulvitalea axinellae]|uniref:FecR family protein n=1 Tax=Fulvitalea axinellae TaxID=1182444 RepID=A0AAU9D2K5_9BACT|nr:hypothetical protein FUAX_43040 [Fulvitalea axinellae]
MTDNILVRYICGEASEMERRFVESIVAEDEEVHVRLEEFRKAKEESEKGAQALTQWFDRFNGWEEFEQHKSNRQSVVLEESKDEKPIRRLWPLYTRVAASLIFILAIGIWFFGNDRPEYADFDMGAEYGQKGDYVWIDMAVAGKSKSTGFDGGKATVSNDTAMYASSGLKTGTLAYRKVKVPTGRRFYIRLTDGTGVLLNAGSVFCYPQTFDTKCREVFLNGEAIFEVAKDADRPFTVGTARATVKVLGTVFNLRAFESEGFENTALLEGSVELASEKGKVRLKPGEYVEISNGKYKAGKTDINEKMAWKRGALVFGDRPFGEMIPEIERFYGVKLRCDNKALLKAEFSGSFEGESLEEMLTGMSGIFDFEFRISDDKKYAFLK